MIPPGLLQRISADLCERGEVEGVVIVVFHSGDFVEVVPALRREACLSLPEAFRKMAAQAEGLAPDTTLAQPEGANRPGEVFRLNENARQWSGLLVTATAVHDWGIEAFAHVPQQSGKCNRLHLQARWEELKFVGRPSPGYGPTSWPGENRRDAKSAESKLADSAVRAPGL